MEDGSCVIHLVDDEPDIVSTATNALRKSGYNVHSFSSPSKALHDIEMACKKHVGMLITDVRMPGYSGFEIARRTRLVKPEVPVIFMTAFEMNFSEFEKMFPSLKVHDFLQKPFHVNGLLGMVKKYIE
jgi:FixJ family two-component response regulator